MTNRKTAHELALDLETASDNYADAVAKVIVREQDLYAARMERDRLLTIRDGAIKAAEQRMLEASKTEQPNSVSPEGDATK